MRFVPSHCLQENMVLAKNIYSYEGIVLLAADVSLTKEYIDSIKKLSINGVYIKDDISKEIEIRNIISEKLRIEAVKSISLMYTDTSKLILNRIEMIVERILGEVLSNRSLMVNMIDIKSFDDYIFTHAVHVAILSLIIGISLNLDSKQLKRLTMGALLHDIGKVFIPKEILNKDEDITDEEKVILKKHPELGYKYIKKYYSFPPTAYIGILQHHERYDGNGYPDQKSGDGISIFGRIICICNVYDNLISEKPNKKAYLPSDAIEYIMGNSGMIFDPKLVKIFIKKVAPYPLGTIIKLSNGEKAIVIENNENCSMRPKVKNLEGDKIYDLTYDSDLKNITIVGVEYE
jgi:HD-GYP domain-containing protein (c-di-GMP phosphodiesterase class II)